MSGIPHQLSSLKVHTIEQRGESNPKHLSYVSYMHRLFVQVLGKALAWRERIETGIYQFMHYFSKGIQQRLLLWVASLQNGDGCPTNAVFFSLGVVSRDV